MFWGEYIGDFRSKSSVYYLVMHFHSSSASSYPIRSRSDISSKAPTSITHSAKLRQTLHSTAPGVFRRCKEKNIVACAGLSVGFTAAAVSEYQTALERIAAKASDELEASSGTVINVCPMLGNAALSAAVELTFGGGELDEELVGDILKIMPRWPGQSKSEILIDGIGARFPIFFRAATLYLRSFKLLRQVQAQAIRVGRQILREKAAAMESGSVDMGHDLYSRLLSNTSGNKRKLTEDEITAQTSILLVAGHETTATTLAFGLLELARNPEFQQRLREELNTRQGNIAYDSLPC
ncbi:Cytochrome P450 [Mycena sanguinolenta]|uniref:Cytochrome P450 n=1 Tax=Mycena sanguinolenta TaxID=230812 RepID=A0A8H6U3D3_9AGAR|nr:Cytochrome P450 [Mycena sanguinolenta]